MDVFISYSSKDKAIADDVCSALENSGIKCWIAPRNIQPGAPYARAIINGIYSAEIFLLILTSDSNDSEHVINEVDIAFNAKKNIIPFFVEEVAMNPELNYYLSRKQWFIAYPNSRERLDVLVKTIAGKLHIEIKTDGGENHDDKVYVVKKEESLKKNNGREYVDLGLPSGLKWATCNVGATKPEEYGDFYAWGEIETKKIFLESTYAHCVKLLFITKYNSIGNSISGTEYDVAHVKWKGSWRLPTASELDELCLNCTWTWISQNGVDGYRVTGPNGNSIFLPAAGYREGAGVNNRGCDGYYWSSSLYGAGNNLAYNLRFYNGNRHYIFNDRYHGLSVRPVSK